MEDGLTIFPASLLLLVYYSFPRGGVGLRVAGEGREKGRFSWWPGPLCQQSQNWDDCSGSSIVLDPALKVALVCRGPNSAPSC